VPEHGTHEAVVVPRDDITHHGAQTLVRSVVGEATQLGIALSVAVVDNAGALVCFDRLDAAPRFSAQIAVAKARTAATFANATSELERLFRDRAVFANSFASQGDWYFGRGGFPIVVNGAVVGGIGVSGESADREEELARRAAASLGSDTPQ
jgi:uncharacterized protein GlcG (DUF336 family)